RSGKSERRFDSGMDVMDFVALLTRVEYTDRPECEEILEHPFLTNDEILQDIGNSAHMISTMASVPTVPSWGKEPTTQEKWTRERDSKPKSSSKPTASKSSDANRHIRETGKRLKAIYEDEGLDFGADPEHLDTLIDRFKWTRERDSKPKSSSKPTASKSSDANRHIRETGKRLKAIYEDEGLDFGADPEHLDTLINRFK
ncbi:hypothetical protein PENTCL1PPCAC_8825, partial [Pristionchus entomophagus]